MELTKRLSCGNSEVKNLYTLQLQYHLSAEPYVKVGEVSCDVEGTTEYMDPGIEHTPC